MANRFGKAQARQKHQSIVDQSEIILLTRLEIELKISQSHRLITLNDINHGGVSFEEVSHQVQSKTAGSAASSPTH